MFFVFFVNFFDRAILHSLFGKLSIAIYHSQNLVLSEMYQTDTHAHTNSETHRHCPHHTHKLINKLAKSSMFGIHQHNLLPLINPIKKLVISFISHIN